MSKFNAGKASVLAITAIFAVAAFLLGKTITPVLATITGPRWTVCHATGSTTNPYTRNVVSSKSQGGHFDNNGDPTTAHSLDILLDGDVDCPENYVSITHQSLTCGTQDVQIKGTAAYDSNNRRLLVYLDNIEKLNNTNEPTTWDAGTYSLGVGNHTVYAKIISTISGGQKAETTWTFSIESCPPIACVGVWSNTSVCSKTCDSGVLQQTFTITTPASNGGTCSNNNGDLRWGTTACNTESCYTPACGNERVDDGEQCDDGNANSNDGCSSTCQTETTGVCRDEIANNFDSSLDAGEYPDNKVCTYSTHRWCKEVCNDELEDTMIFERGICTNPGYEAVVVPNNEDNPSGKPWETGMDRYCVISVTPEPTPDPDVCKNIDGVQTSVPEGQHLDASGLNCVNWSGSGPAPRNDEGTGTTGTVLGASTVKGQVLGATTMAGTGSFAEVFYQAIMGIGATLSAFGIKGLKKGKKAN